VSVACISRARRRVELVVIEAYLHCHLFPCGCHVS
jgi:hypothetical protein